MDPSFPVMASLRGDACSPEEIRNAIRLSSAGMSGADEHDFDTNFDETSLLDSSYESDLITVNESAARHADPDRGTDEVFIPKRCLPEDSNYCFNGGECFADYLTENHTIKFCRCAPNWHGRQCQYYFNPKLYESARIGPEVESMAFTSMLAIVLVGFVVVSGLLYISRTFCKTRDLRDLIWFDASGSSSDHLTPMQLYPFSRRTTSPSVLSPSTRPQPSSGNPSTLSTSSGISSLEAMPSLYPRSTSPSLPPVPCILGFSRRNSSSSEPMLPPVAPICRRCSNFDRLPLASSTPMPAQLSYSPFSKNSTTAKRLELSVIEFL